MTTNKISKEDFMKLKEEDLMFITNPGRMGNEDGSTFIIRQDNNFTMYKVEGWMYPKTGEKIDISLNDFYKQFPKWYETLKNERNKDYEGKYKYVYMGFGNGLCIDKSIYNEYELYLKEEVEKYLENCNDKKSLKYAAIYNVWKDAFINMINNEKYI